MILNAWASVGQCIRTGYWSLRQDSFWGKQPCYLKSYDTGGGQGWKAKRKVVDSKRMTRNGHGAIVDISCVALWIGLTSPSRGNVWEAAVDFGGGRGCVWMVIADFRNAFRDARKAVPILRMPSETSGRPLQKSIATSERSRRPFSFPERPQRHLGSRRPLRPKSLGATCRDAMLTGVEPLPGCRFNVMAGSIRRFCPPRHSPTALIHDHETATAPHPCQRLGAAAARRPGGNHRACLDPCGGPV